MTRSVAVSVILMRACRFFVCIDCSYAIVLTCPFGARGKTPGKEEDRQMPCNYGALLKSNFVFCKIYLMEQIIFAHSKLLPKVTSAMRLRGLAIYQFCRKAVDVRSRFVIQGFRPWRTLETPHEWHHGNCGQHQFGTQASAAEPA